MSNGGAFYEDLIKLKDFSSSFLQPYAYLANESYKNYISYVDKYLITNYSNILINQELYSAYIESFIPAHDEEFTRITTAINSKYNPIQNYDMTEKEEGSRTQSGITISTTQSGSKTINRDLNGSMKVVTEVDTAVINQNALKKTDEQTVITTPTDYGETTKETYDNFKTNEKTTFDNPEGTSRTLTRSGNIGVTTSQQMITSTFELENQNKIIYYIANVFVNELTTGVYDYD